MNTETVILPNQFVAFLFSNRWAGFILFGILLAWASQIILSARRKSYLPFLRALDERLAATEMVAQQPDQAQAKEVFAAQFDAINAAMIAGDSAGDKELRHAWTEFRETFIDDRSEVLIEATARPDGYFLHLGDNSRGLAWWANIFVAMGLTATFLGIIAALAGAVATVGGGNMQQMQQGLMTLLTMTATKFWTSIGGVGASILLRLIARHWQKQTDQKLEELCSRLEYGTHFSPPQRLAAEQLRELKQQSVALTEFSHQLAASIGDALGQHMQPVVAGLSGIQSSLNDFREGSFSQIGTQLGDAISKGAGLEMQALAGALESMTSGIAGVNDRLEGASGQASEQIAAAAREFSGASLEMTRAFAALNQNIDGMAQRMADQTRETEERQRNRVQTEQDAFTSMAQAQREALMQTREDLRTASAASASEMTQAVQTAVNSAMTDSSRAFAALNDNINAMAQRLIEQTGDAEERQRARVAEERTAFEGMADQQRLMLTQASDVLRTASTASTNEMVAAVKSAISIAMGESTRAVSNALDGFNGATAGIQQAFDQMKAQVAELGEKLAGSTSDAADRNADVLRKAADALEQVAGRAKTQMGEALTDAIDRSTAEAAKLISEAFARFGAEFGKAGSDLTSTLVTTAGRMEMLAGAFDRSASSADGYAEKIAGAGREAHLAVTTLGQATQALGATATPIAKAVSAIETATVRSGETVRALGESNARYHALIQDVTGQMKETAQAAVISWESYRARFAEVDQSLGEALDRIRAASAEHATALNTEVGKIDLALADAVLRLAPALEVLQELTASLDDLRRTPMAAE